MPFNPYTNTGIQQGLQFRSQPLAQTQGLSFNANKRVIAPPAPTGGGGGMKFENGGVAGGVAAATGLIDIATGAAAMGDNAVAQINQKAPTEQLDENGQPLYNLGGFASDTTSIKPQGPTGAEVGGMAAKGAAAGMAFGPWGAAIGGVVGAIGGFFGGRRRKRKMAEAKRKAIRSLHRMQKNYNVNAENFQQNQVQQQEYADQMNKTDRMANLYGNNQQIMGS